MDTTPLLQWSRRRGRITLRLRCLHMGNDCCFLVDGGDSPHTGALCLAGADGCVRSLCVSGHREEDLARNLAQRLRQTTGTTVTVLCGIHVENITAAEIQDVYALCDALCADALRQLTTDLRPPDPETG